MRQAPKPASSALNNSSLSPHQLLKTEVMSV